MRKKQMKKQKQIIIASVFSLLLIMTIGYAAFSTTLNIGAKGNIVDKSVDITDNVVTTGDGLYEDTYEEGRYVYKGSNPNNYIEFDNGELWRIIAKEADGTYKIVKNDLLPNQAWDTNNSNNWETSTLNIYLNGEYYNDLDNVIKNYIVSHTWGVGFVTYDNNDLAAQIQSENESMWSGNIGLIAASDYLRANTNETECATHMFNNDNNSICKNTNWLVASNHYWTISPYSSALDYEFRWDIDGSLYGTHTNEDDIISPRPAAYLSSDIALTGNGTSDNPYKIIL